MNIRHAGGTPRDYSSSPPAVPAGSPLITIPMNTVRNSVEVQNQSAAQITLVRDDGMGDASTISTIYLPAASAAGAPGGSWSSVIFKGRLRVYGIAGSQVSAYEE